MINLIEVWSRRIIGLMFLAAGLYMVISNNYSEVLMVMLSVFSLAHWWKG